MIKVASKIDSREVDLCISEVAKGNMNSLKQLYEQFKVPVYLLALVILKDRALAEDILQETFIGLRANAHTYSLGTNAKAWILSITRNLSKNCLRKRHYETSQSFDEDTEVCDKKYTVETDMLDGIVTSDALNILDETQREIVVFHVFTGLKHTEISKLLCIPYGTVLWKYSVAMKKLRAFYNAEFSGEGVVDEK